MALNGKRTDGQWLGDLLRPMVLAAMLTCLLAPIVVGLERLLVGWEGTYLLVFAFLAGLEGILSERALQERDITAAGYLVSRGAEGLILLLVLKLLNYIPLGLDRLLADARLWASDLGQFVSYLDLSLSLAFLLFWGAAIYVARVAQELDVKEREESPPEDRASSRYYLWVSRPAPLSDRQRTLDRLAELFVWGGVYLLLAALVIHFLLSSARVLALPTLLYFALGVALLSQGRFSVLQATWQLHGIPVQRGIGRRWLLWATLFFVAVALVALVLPTHYTMGPLLALLSLFTILVNVVSFLFFLLIFLITLPLAFLFPHLEQSPRPIFAPGSIARPEAVPPGASPGEAFLSALFWLLVLAIVGYALLRFFRDRAGLWGEEELAGTWWGHLLNWLRRLWRRWRAWGQETQMRLVRRRPPQERSRGGLGSTFRFFFPGRLPPREMVRYFYLSVARRAAQAGQSRRASQTPFEYQATLDEHFPELEPDLAGLTETFVKARYSREPLERREAEAVKPLWRRIKAALRRRRAGL